MMPVWLQLFYIVFSIIILGWGVWMTKTLLSHTDAITILYERDARRGEEYSQLQLWKDACIRTLGKINRNIVRLGTKLGFEKDLEEE